MDGRLYQIAIVPIMAPARLAWVVMGFNMDDAWATRFAAMSGLGIAVITTTKGKTAIAASSLAEAPRQALAAGEALPPPAAPVLRSLAGSRHHIDALTR